MNNWRKSIGCGILAFGLTLTAPFLAGRAYAAEEGIITGSVVNVRSGNSLEEKVITQVRQNDVVTVSGQSDGWYEVTLSDGVQGWICGEYVAVPQEPSREAQGKRGIVTGSAVNVRTGGSLNAEIIGKLPKGTLVTITGWKDGWFSVKLSNGKEGWMCDDYVSADDGTASRGDVDRATGDGIVEYAEKYLGAKYAYGGSSPSGFDCSGFACYVFEHFDVELPRTSHDQSQGGVYISKDELAPGDLVFFSFNGGEKVDHTGIYIGDGKFIHSSNKRTGVMISPLSGTYADTYVTARRYI